MTDTTPTPPDASPRPPAPTTRDDAARKPDGAGQVDKPRPDPTRYGDWEKNGRCIDF